MLSEEQRLGQFDAEPGRRHSADRELIEQTLREIRKPRDGARNVDRDVRRSQPGRSELPIVGEHAFDKPLAELRALARDHRRRP